MGRECVFYFDDFWGFYIQLVRSVFVLYYEIFC